MKTTLTSEHSLLFNKLQAEKRILRAMHLLEGYRLAHRMARWPGESEVIHT